MASVSVSRSRLYLLATLPPKPGREGAPRQQRIALLLDDTPTNRRVAARRLAVLERQLERGSFCWDDWLQERKGMRWREAINALHRQKVLLGRTSASTWEINYLGRLRQIDAATLVTTESIEAALNRYERNTRSYRELLYLMRHIARIAAVPMPEAPLPTYSGPAPMVVPTDDEIEAVLDRAGPVVQWHLGMMACYGLRPSELDDARLIAGDRVSVSPGTKTGARLVVACPPEWVERFNLRERRPRLYTPRGGEWRPDITARWLWRELKRLDVQWRPYALRHAYAGRLWRAGGSRLNLYTAARLMGHSVAVHVRTYRAFIDPHTIADDAERALSAQS